MKEDVLDVLLYVFENYQETGLPADPGADALKTELEAAGFHQQQVASACDWLEQLAVQQRAPGLQASASAARVFTAAESDLLSAGCRGFILNLEQMGILSADLRETVIDRLMALAKDGAGEPLDLEQAQWVVLMVLFNHPGREAAYAWVEDLVYHEQDRFLH